MINGICEWKCFNYCENGGSCYIALKEPYCDCDNTGYHGKFNRVRLSLMNLSEMSACERVDTFLWPRMWDHAERPTMGNCAETIDENSKR